MHTYICLCFCTRLYTSEKPQASQLESLTLPKDKLISGQRRAKNSVGWLVDYSTLPLVNSLKTHSKDNFVACYLFFKCISW